MIRRRRLRPAAVVVPRDAGCQSRTVVVVSAGRIGPVDIGQVETLGFPGHRYRDRGHRSGRSQVDRTPADPVGERADQRDHREMHGVGSQQPPQDVVGRRILLDLQICDGEGDHQVVHDVFAEAQAHCGEHAAGIPLQNLDRMVPVTSLFGGNCAAEHSEVRESSAVIAAWNRRSLEAIWLPERLGQFDRYGPRSFPPFM